MISMKLSHFMIRTKTSRKTLETLEQQLWVHFQREGYGACGFGVVCGVRSSVVYRGQLRSYSLGHNESFLPLAAQGQFFCANCGQG